MAEAHVDGIEFSVEKAAQPASGNFRRPEHLLTGRDIEA